MFGNRLLEFYQVSNKNYIFHCYFHQRYHIFSPALLVAKLEDIRSVVVSSEIVHTVQSAFKQLFLMTQHLCEALTGFKETSAMLTLIMITVYSLLLICTNVLNRLQDGSIYPG
jgi:hypothetical protein